MRLARVVHAKARGYSLANVAPPRVVQNKRLGESGTREGKGLFPSQRGAAERCTEQETGGERYT